MGKKPTSTVVAKPWLAQAVSAHARRARARIRAGSSVLDSGAGIGEVFACRTEAYARKALERQLQIDARGRQIDQRAAVIARQIVVSLQLELLQFAFLPGADPTRRVHADGLEDALDSVLVGQSEGHHLELQRPDRAQDQFRISQGAKQLRG